MLDWVCPVHGPHRYVMEPEGTPDCHKCWGEDHLGVKMQPATEAGRGWPDCSVPGCGHAAVHKTGRCLFHDEAGCVWCGATGYGKECPPCEVKHATEAGGKA